MIDLHNPVRKSEIEDYLSNLKKLQLMNKLNFNKIYLMN